MRRLRTDGRLVFDQPALETTARNLRNLGYSASQISHLAKRHREEALSDTAEYLKQVAAIMRRQEKGRHDA